MPEVAEWAEANQWRKAVGVRGLYALLNGPLIVYVGKSEESIGERVRAHKEGLKLFTSFSWLDFGHDPEIDLGALEREVIQELDPLYNLRMSGYDMGRLALIGKLHLAEKEKERSLRNEP
ncbi:MAG: GIY-YIG nuclease family protein [Verrucomicrobia bacterium]|nr:GIY-YIG nuclease family protein [Verrucomicrobiota bacterium]